MSLFALGLGYSARALVDRGGPAGCGGTVRAPAAAAALRKAGIEGFTFDGGAAEPGLVAALQRATVLVVSIPPGASGDPALAALGREIAASRRLRRILYLSTVGVYGDWRGDWVDETSPTRARAPRALRRVEAEAAWRRLGADMGVEVDVMRLAGIYGPGRNALERLRAGDARRVVKPDQVFNRIHVADIAGAALRLIERDEPGGVWNIADREPAPPQDVIAFAADLLGVAPPAEEPFEGAAMSEMARSFYEDNRRVSIGKLEREAGYPLQFPTYREGLRALWAAGEGRG